MFAPLHIPNMSAVKDVQGDCEKVYKRVEHYRPRYILVQVQIEKKEKNKSREEIFYQIKVYFCLDPLYEVFFVNRPGAHD